MTAYQVLTMAAWSIVWLYMLRAALNAAFGKTVRRGDPMRLALWILSMVMIVGSGRFLFAPDNTLLWKIVYIVAIADALYIVRLGRAYGRGPDMTGGDDA